MLSQLLASRKLCVVLATLFSSCASYKVYQLPEDSKKARETEGIRFNRPSPYLMIGADPANVASNKLTVTLLYLPDRSATYVVRKRGFVGSAEAQIKLQDGWNLVEYGSKSDSKLPEALTAIAALAGAVLPKAASGAQPLTKDKAVFPSPGLWRILFDGAGQISGVELVPGTANQ